MLHYVYTKPELRENILNGFSFMELTRFVTNRQTDRDTDRQTDRWLDVLGLTGHGGYIYI